jgi:hypothetical protein
MGLGPVTAAQLAAVLVESDDPIKIEAVESLLVVASSTFDPKSTTLDKHSQWLARKSRRILERAERAERLWLTHSAAAVVAVVRFSAAGNTTGMRRALAMLECNGWQGVIERVQRRVGAGVLSNFSDFEGKLGRLGRALLKSVRENPSGRKDL